MSTRFQSDFFAGNRERLRELFTGTAPIVLTANGLLQKQADEAFPFKQDPNFWYLTGIDEPDLVVVLDKDKEFLIIPERDARRVTFEGAIDEAKLRQMSGIDMVYGEAEGWKRLGARLEKAKHVATLSALPSYNAAAGLYANPARQRMIKRLKQYNPALELLDISEHIARLRAVKQPQELAAMQAAIDLTGKALKRLGHKLNGQKYGYEYEAEAELSQLFRVGGASDHAFAPIVAGGERACTLHYQANNALLAAGQLVVCDVGAEVDHYAADITRTFAVGNPSRRQQAIYAAVLEVQQFAVTQLRPGVVPLDYEKTVSLFMGEQLRELGLIKSIDDDAVREFYPHKTSHFLGLDTHDVGAYDQPLQAGMVVTVAPGIYVRTQGIGVRIEDDLLITAEGTQILSTKIPKILAYHE